MKEKQAVTGRSIKLSDGAVEHKDRQALRPGFSLKYMEKFKHRRVLF